MLGDVSQWRIWFETFFVSSLYVPQIAHILCNLHSVVFFYFAATVELPEIRRIIAIPFCLASIGASKWEALLGRVHEKKNMLCVPCIWNMV